MRSLLKIVDKKRPKGAKNSLRCQITKGTLHALHACVFWSHVQGYKRRPRNLFLRSRYRPFLLVLATFQYLNAGYKKVYFQVVAPINKLIETCPFDLICYSLDWHPSDHISFFENVANRPLDPSSAITDASRTKVGDTVVFTGPPKTEQKLWPAHCIQESWGSEFHKDLIVSFNFYTKSGLYCTKTIRSILKAKSSTRDSIPILTPIRHFSTTKNWAKQKWRTF